MNNLEINKKITGDEVVLNCTGRLDANRAGYLNDYIDGLIRDGQYYISLDLTGIEYLSSAGIRSMVTQYKNLKSINGYFYIKEMSKNVNQVLSMVGMADMLSTTPKKIKTKEPVKSDISHKNDFGFKVTHTPLACKENSNVEFYGNPELALTSKFTEKNARLVQSSDNHFAFGLGAIGVSFEECKDRFGEYMMLGKNVAYLPGDGSKKPDYMVSSGQFVASLTELYGIHFSGNFKHLIRFEADRKSLTVGISQLIEGIQQLTSFDQFALVMIAESGGLIGVSLNESPVERKKIFSFPEIKETVNFTTEPAYNKMLTLSTGYFSSTGNEISEKFIRPIKPDNPITGHVHTAIFPYIPLKRTDIDLNETIELLFNNSELVDLIHLTNDTRGIVGLGESQFVQGFCWIAPIESSKSINK